MINYIRITSAAALLAGVAGAAVVLEEKFEGAKFPPAGWEKVEVKGVWTREHVGAPYNWCAYFHSYAYVGGEGTLGTKGQTLATNDYRVSFAYRYRVEPASGTASAETRVERLEGEVWQVVSSWPLPRTSTFQVFEFKYAASQDGTYRLLFYAEAAEEAIVFFRVDDVLWESGPFTAVAPASLGGVKALYY
ncbi:MAG: hypothetical protein GTN49_11950 [candidate division Zixibacteria bacterium]|nr:hypothetical protein [candidate division Zixibacteria bacterium]